MQENYEILNYQKPIITSSVEKCSCLTAAAAAAAVVVKISSSSNTQSGDEVHDKENLPE